MSEHFIGIDVGTGSARAGVFDGRGRLVASAKRPIRIWREEGSIVEQSSSDIWASVVACVREAVAMAGVQPATVRGIGFDATCSLVVLDGKGRPLAVGPSEENERDVIVWMDHRATDQARRINETGHPVLNYVGGIISPEMETPKLLWLKEMRPATFAAAGHFFDLADFLSWRATESLQRSACTLTCKWTYLAHERRWDEDYFRRIGLGELADEGFRRIGSDVVDIGVPLGDGLSAEAAAEFGLPAGISVGASLIDAHAGGVGTLGASRSDGAPSGPLGELALIMGTSACAMAVTREAAFVDGVWGPYFSAMLPGYWLLEGGQSAYGAALDHLVSMHPAFAEGQAEAKHNGLSLLDFLERRAIEAAGSVETAATLAKAIHVVPEFLGNRAPEADPEASAVLAGLGLDAGIDGLTRLFVAALCGLCYGTKQILDAMRARSVGIDAIVVSGGAARSQLLRRILADATGTRVVLPETPEPVLLGSAMIGAVASGAYEDLGAAAAAMCRSGDEIEPVGGGIAEFHARKFAAYEILKRAEREVRKTMASA